MNVLLDLDGTLTDPRQGILGCIRHALTGLGADCPADAEMEQFIGPPLHETFRSILGEDEARIQRAIALYRERFTTTGLFENLVYPEIPAALRALRAQGARLHLATSKPLVFAERILGHFGLAAAFRSIHGSELDGTRSNKGELIAHILRTEGIPPASARMVGDRKHDMAGAAANGVAAIGVLWGFGSREELLSSGAAALCERPSGLPDALDFPKSAIIPAA